MENQNRVGRILLLLAGFALVLCVGMAMGGALVYGVMRIGDLSSGGVELGHLDLQFDEPLQDEPQLGPEESVIPGSTTGAVIIEVLPDTPAERAGLQEGDLVVTVDSQQIGPAGNLARLIAQYEPGDRVTLQVRRGDEEPSAVRVTLGENPDDPGAPYLGVLYQSALPEGMSLDEMLPLPEQGEWQLDELPIPLPGDLGVSGTFVISVTVGGPADNAGLEHGDLITTLDGESVASAEAFSDAISQREPGERVTLGVVRAGDQIEVGVLLGEHPEQPGRAYLGVTIGDSFYHFRGRWGQDEMPFDWDDLWRRFHLQPPPADDGAL